MERLNALVCVVVWYGKVLFNSVPLNGMELNSITTAVQKMVVESCHRRCCRLPHRAALPLDACWGSATCHLPHLLIVLLIQRGHLPWETIQRFYLPMGCSRHPPAFLCHHQQNWDPIPDHPFPAEVRRSGGVVPVNWWTDDAVHRDEAVSRVGSVDDAAEEVAACDSHTTVDTCRAIHPTSRLVRVVVRADERAVRAVVVVEDSSPHLGGSAVWGA